MSPPEILSLSWSYGGPSKPKQEWTPTSGQAAGRPTWTASRTFQVQIPKHRESHWRVPFHPSPSERDHACHGAPPGRPLSRQPRWSWETPTPTQARLSAADRPASLLCSGFPGQTSQETAELLLSQAAAGPGSLQGRPGGKGASGCHGARGRTRPGGRRQRCPGGCWCTPWSRTGRPARATRAGRMPGARLTGAVPTGHQQGPGGGALSESTVKTWPPFPAAARVLTCGRCNCRPSLGMGWRDGV